MGSIQRRDRNRFKARYRGPDGRERSKIFTTRRDAESWLALSDVQRRRGEWVDPQLAEITVGEWAESWIERKAIRLKPSTLAMYEMLLRVHVLPTWRHVRLRDVTYGDVEAWVHRMAEKVGPSSVRKTYGILLQILDAAVKDGRLARNSAKGVEMPGLPRHEHQYLTHQQVRALAEAAGSNQTLIYVLAYCGLRFGEAAALHVSEVDVLRGRIRVAQSVTEVRGQLVWGSPKTGRSRSVGVPKFLRQMLAEEMSGKAPEDLLFTGPEGTAIRLNNWRRRVWAPAAAAAGLTDLTPHGLRHTAASLAIQAGANVKAVQTMLGHASASMTLDTYATLWDEGLDHVASRLDEDRSEANVASTWPGAAPVVRELRR